MVILSSDTNTTRAPRVWVYIGGIMDWETIKTEELNGVVYSVEITPDQDYEAPCDFENGYAAFFSNSTRNYGSLGTKYTMDDYARRGLTLSRAKVRMRQDLGGNAWRLFNVRAYIHSGVAFSLSTAGQFSDAFDSGLGGVLAINLEAMGWAGTDNNDAKAAAAAGGIVEEMNQWVQGDVYGYRVLRDGEEIDSLWGLWGRAYAKEEACGVIEAVVASAAKVEGVQVDLELA